MKWFRGKGNVKAKPVESPVSAAPTANVPKEKPTHKETLLREWEKRYDSYISYRTQYIFTMNLASVIVGISMTVAITKEGLDPQVRNLALCLSLVATVGLFIAHVLGVGVISKLRQRMMKLEREIPMAPFDTVGCLLKCLWLTMFGTAMCVAVVIGTMRHLNKVDSKTNNKVELSYDNGMPMENYHAIDKDGKKAKHGPYVSWYKNGQRQMVCNYVNGKQDGPFTIWYENGQKMLEGQYVNGKQHGTETAWLEDGRKKLEYCYDNGAFTGEKIFTPPGIPKE